jgi:membrane protein
VAARLKHVFNLTRTTFAKFSADGCGRIGAALAYYSFFSLFPLLLLLISILGYLLASGVPLLIDARTYVLDSVESTLPQARDLLARSIDAAERARGTTGFVGLLTLMWSASNVFTQLYQALNLIWGCSSGGTIWAAVRTKLTAFAMVLGISFLLLVAVIVDVALPVAARQLGFAPGWRLVWVRFGALSPVFMATTIFALLYRYLPDTKVLWRDAWPGALLAGVAWEILRQGFIVYTTRYANYAAMYGAVGSTIALLSWIYLSAQVLLFGAEFSVVYGRLRTCRQTPIDPPSGA